HVVAGLTTGQVTAELRIDSRAKGDVLPVLLAPHPAGILANVWSGPVVGEHGRARPILDAPARLGRELVAQAGVDAPAFDVLACAVVDTGVTEPSGIGDGCRGAEAKLGIGADPVCRQRRIELRAEAPAWSEYQRVEAAAEPRGHLAREFMEHTGGEEGLPKHV